ncbi:MAG: alanine--tRNA ligase [Alphaproteobacteria bacterium]|nr:alanine--tRNA ligase [Alphaproteobacteria bacterium]
MLSASEIRARFLDFYKGRGHEVVPSSALVPHQDPTLLFTNAGMVQFKNVFTGVEKRAYTRAASSQKCVRAGGKHNDLENVGYTARHHTFFEMLGNFSFGDYFKEEAILSAWTLLHKDCGIAKERMLVTVYVDDDEAARLWKKIAGYSDDKIIRIAGTDNFWSMGDVGPCGPCTEIFFDHGPHIKGGPPGSEDADGDRFVEIWNLVFMQYEQFAGGERKPLPRPSIDTGMGLERISAVMQGKHDNYDTDLLRGLILASAEVSKQAPDGPHKVSHRVVADHLRSTCFLMADGVMPSNEGRGYVLRRIMRRAMRHAHLMGVPEPLMHRLVPALVSAMGAQYPELIRAQPLMTETLKLEEMRFRETLARGLAFLEEALGKLPKDADLPGEAAFKLYDTYGFPLDLTQDALRPRGGKVDTAGFDAAMDKQRQAARAAWAGSGEQATEAVWFDLRQRLGATEFLGYESDLAEAKVLAILQDGKEVPSAGERAEVQVIVNQTPFYGESGGQKGDCGMMTAAGTQVAVKDTQKKVTDLHVHEGTVTKGTLKVGQVVELKIDSSVRTRLRANHSATHLLHAALRRTLGPHVTQKGSLVAPDRLRFDFSQPVPISAEDLARIEAQVNEQTRRNVEVQTLLMPPAEAVKNGAMALFGEKYGDEVRVVSMGLALGAREDQKGDDKHFSTELCGGTHVRRTGDIGYFKIVSEAGVAAGVRRIEALTGAAAAEYAAEQEGTLKDAAAALKAQPSELPARVTSLLDERKRLEREIADLRKKLATGGGAGAGSTVKDVNGVRFASRNVDGAQPGELKGMVDELKKNGSGIYAVVAVNEGKASLVVGVTPDLVGRFNAVDLVKLGVAALGGKGGGGRPDMAQGGGPEGAQAEAALAAVEQAIARTAQAA